MSQSTAGTSITANAIAATRTICAELRIAWGRTADTWPTDWTTQATNETTRMLDASWDRRFNLDGHLTMEGAPVAQLKITLDNSGQRFAPYNTSSAIYSSISANATTPGGTTVRYSTMWQVPVRLRMGFVDGTNGAEYLTVFSGLIDVVSDPYGVDGNRVTLTCTDRGGALLKRKYSSVVYENMPVDAYLRILVSSLGGIATGNTLDRSTFILPFAWLDDEGLWADAQDAAAADGGYAFFDELGVFYYRNMAWWATATASTVSQATLNTAHFTTLTPSVSWKDVATGAIVEYQPRAHGGEQTVWRADNTLVLPPGETIIQAKFNNPATYLIPPAKPGDWYPVTSGGMSLGNDVTVTFVNAYAQRCDLNFQNGAGQTAYIPKMQIRGLVLVGGPQEQVEENVTTPLVPENKVKVDGNPYVQTRAQAGMLAVLAASRMRYPRLTYKTSGPALPWLQLGDCVTIEAAEPLTTARPAIVTGLAFSWAPDQAWMMTVDAVDSAALFEYANYHVIGTTNYGVGVAFV